MIDSKLLHLLLNQDQPVTLLGLAQNFKVDVRTVSGALQRLCDDGCTLTEHPQLGVKLVQAGLGTWRDYLKYTLDLTNSADSAEEFQKKVSSPRIIQVYDQTQSTQNRARSVVETAGKDGQGAVIVADRQTAGRGRMGRRWLAPAGGAVTFSRVQITNRQCNKIKSAEQDKTRVDNLTFIASVAVARGLDVFLKKQGKRCQINWPNDMMVNGRKIAGILVENFSLSSQLSAAIIGVGINVNLTEDEIVDRSLKQKITSLLMNNVSVDRLAVLGEVNQQLDKAIAKKDTSFLLAEWRRRCTMLGKQMTLNHKGSHISGQVVDLDPYAGLVVRQATGQLIHLPAATTTKVI